MSEADQGLIGPREGQARAGGSAEKCQASERSGSLEAVWGSSKGNTSDLGCFGHLDQKERKWLWKGARNGLSRKKRESGDIQAAEG